MYAEDIIVLKHAGRRCIPCGELSWGLPQPFLYNSANWKLAISLQQYLSNDFLYLNTFLSL